MAKTRNLGNLSNVLTQVGNFAQQQTPAQFDNGLNLATTAFVKGQVGGYAGIVSFTTTTTLTAAQANNFINCAPTVASQVLTLPLANTVPSGNLFYLQNVGTVSFSVQRQGTDILLANTSSRTAISLKPGDTLIAVSTGASNWMISGSATLSVVDSGAFQANIALPGYQKLPTGLILQWGSFTATTAGVGVSFPLIFPTALLSLSITFVGATNSTVPSIGAGSGGVTGFNAYSNSATPGCQYMAIGW